MADAGDVTYSGYLKIPELLGLQQTRSDPAEHDAIVEEALAAAKARQR